MKLLKSAGAMQMQRTMGWLLLGCLLATLWAGLGGWLAPPATAHQDDLVVATVAMDASEARVILTLPTALLTNFDDNRDGRLVPEELQHHREQIVRFFSHRFSLRDEGDRLGEIAAIAPAKTAAADLPPEAPLTQNTHATLALTYRWPEPPHALSVRYALFQTSLQNSPSLPQDHCILTIRHGSQTEKTILSPFRREVTVPLQLSANAPPHPWQGRSLAIALGAAFIWGAAHALSPGHGKTALSA